MPYSIYILSEGLMTVTGTTGGSGLDGVTQGDGSHMDGATVTLNSNAWQEIQINDDDLNFADNDSNQTTVNSETIETSPGTFETFAAGTRVEAEYAVTATDPAGNTYQLVAFNFTTGSPPYATIEALAFIGPQGGFPPINVPLTISNPLEGPSYAASTYATPICFAKGTRIATPSGEVKVEDLRPGDLVLTASGSAEPIRWVGRRSFAATGRFAPVEFRTGVLGNIRPLRVSRQHRLRLGGWQSELYFGEEAVWVPAAHFLGLDGVRVAEGGEVTYFHLLLDGHRTLIADGVEAESLHPGDVTIDAIGAEAQAELLAMFPELMDLQSRETSHAALTRREARVLVEGELQH